MNGNTILDEIASNKIAYIDFSCGEIVGSRPKSEYVSIDLATYRKIKETETFIEVQKEVKLLPLDGVVPISRSAIQVNVANSQFYTPCIKVRDGRFFFVVIDKCEGEEVFESCKISIFTLECFMFSEISQSIPA